MYVVGITYLGGYFWIPHFLQTWDGLIKRSRIGSFAKQDRRDGIFPWWVFFRHPLEP